MSLLAREIALGLADEHETHVICPSMPISGDVDDMREVGIRLAEWNEGLDYLAAESFLVRYLEDNRIEVAVFHGGDFSWGVLRRRLSTINKIPRRGRSILLINHQSNPAFARMPVREKRSVRERLGGAAGFVAAWVYKNIQLYHLNYEISVSEFERRRASRRYPLFRRKFKRIYHSRLDSVDLEPDWWSRKERLILCVGHYAYRKGQHVLLRAFARIAARHPTWRLQLVGGTNAGEYHERIERMLDFLEIRDRVDLVTETFDPDDYFRRASIYVQPSLFEAYGLALQEAMHFGCACIGSRVGGITDSITDPEYLFSSQDDRQLARIIEGLVENEELLHRRMRESRNFVIESKLNRASMIAQYRELYRSLP
ncbi:glycosyltransferase family 4 protein [Haloferula sp. A504]|uniref:glycosyltransferase family 4 protein n=1 Tax=Haloferula sp. A504 TaxID=3373601 RepID=UPI0031BEAB2B|nr:glycosyltransferase family 4 protein [Verrucomicrobiaceae bacterium E54]